MTKKKNKGVHRPQYSELESLVNEIINSNKGENVSYKQIIKKLGIKDKRSKRALQAILQNANSGGGKTSLLNVNEITGTVDFVNPRFAYIVCEDLEEDIYVRVENLMHAFDDDTVKVSIIKRPGKKGGRAEGKVVEIVNRFRDEFVGRIETSQGFAFVVPDFKKMHNDIFVPQSKIKGAKKQDKVIVKITEWPKGTKKPEGEVVRILGKAGENEAEIHSIIAEFGLPFKFPDGVIRQSEKISDDFTDEEIRHRRDFRDIVTFTVDPADAKDFDDALSLKLLPNGNYEVGVHIADVTHYVKKGSLLDKEAEERATSVYLVDRTIPMLPERLSNELCSLRPDEDKMTFSAVFELDKDGYVRNEWFGKTIIHSDRRFSYEEAQERIETMTGDFAKELKLLNELALKLRLDRFMRGSINFETTEVKFDLDEDGKPLGIIPKIRKDAHKMIEEFMLLANKKVAEFVYRRKKGKVKDTFVYRTHDYPDPEKLTAFSVFAKKFGHDLHIDEAAISRSLNTLIEDIEGKPEQNVLQSLAIRSMAKAKYTTEAKGHFGLAFRHYTHFTSPIRRYPDMMVHRLLYHYLDGGNSVQATTYEKKCQHSSEMEKRAADAERASIKYKQVEFMGTMIGKEMEGIVSGVTEWGVYVEMTATKCEGMVKLADLTDDYYDFDPDNYRIVGQRTGKIITLGDDIRVKVINTDINRRIIDLKLVEDKKKK